MAQALGVTSIPRTFLIDKDHKLFYQHTGFDEGKVNELKEKVLELLGK
jgi:peroxiredoxin